MRILGYILVSVSVISGIAGNAAWIIGEPSLTQAQALIAFWPYWVVTLACALGTIAIWRKTE